MGKTCCRRRLAVDQTAEGVILGFIIIIIIGTFFILFFNADTMNTYKSSAVWGKHALLQAP